MSRLEKLVRTTRKNLVRASVAAGDVDKSAFDRLDRLQKLANEAKPLRRWLVAIIAFILFAAFVASLIMRQDKTEIELDSSVTGAHFRILQQKLLAEDPALFALRAYGLHGIQVDGVDWPAPAGATCALQIELGSSAHKGDAITLSNLEPLERWGIGVSHLGFETKLEFTAPSRPAPSGEPFSPQATVRGKANLFTTCTPHGENSAIPWTGHNSVAMLINANITLLCQSTLPLKFNSGIKFEELLLSAPDSDQISGSSDGRHSTLAGGTLSLDALDSKAVTLRPFAVLSFGASYGYIRTLSTPEDSKSSRELFHLQAHATVQKMKLGAETYSRNLMPSWLQVYAAQTDITLLWQSLVYALGIVYAVLLYFEIIRRR